MVEVRDEPSLVGLQSLFILSQTTSAFQAEAELLICGQKQGPREAGPHQGSPRRDTIPSLPFIFGRFQVRIDPVLGQVEPEFCPRGPGAGLLGEGELFGSFGTYPLGPREPAVKTGGSFPCE